MTGETAYDHLRRAREELLAPGGAFALDEVEVRGIPMRVFATAPPDLRTVWQLAAGHGDAPYLVFEDEHLTYAEVDARVRALAHLLRDTHGVGPGDRVAIAMRNYPEWVIAYWATLVVGAAAVGMNAWWTSAEMAYALRDSRPAVLVCDGERLERVLPELDELRAGGPLAVVAVRHDGGLPDGVDAWDDVVRPDDAPAGYPDATLDGDDDATIFYTSGTTGFPKGAQLTHRGCVANLMNIAFSGIAVATATASMGEPPAAAPARRVMMAATPLFHVTACNCVLHPATLVGGTVALMYKWDAGRAIELIEREKVTNFAGVPTMNREMLLHPDWEERDTSTLGQMSGGGAPVAPELVARIDKAVGSSSPSTGYGLTETCGIVTGNAARFYTGKPASCGPVVPTLDAKLVDEEGNDLAPGPEVSGQLCVRGSNVIKGYLNRPEATAEAIVDGWFHTGDVARIDEDGFVFIVDRIKDMILRGGENVYPAEVEAALHDHDDVLEAAVIGVPDERLGEAVAAVVVPRAGSGLDEAALKAFLQGRIATHKIPSVITVRDEPLPRNANGKFLKRSLKDEFAGT